MTRRTPVLFVLLALLALFDACGGPPAGGANAPAPADRCGDVLAPSLAPAPVPRPTPPLDVAASTIVVHVDVGVSGVRRELEAKVPKRIAEERDHDIGMAGRLEYTVDRGAIAVSAQGDALVVETPLVAHVRACAKGRCYAGCDPEARATARVPLRVDANYKLGPASVRIDVTRGCELRALGGLLRVDVTPILVQRLAQERPRIEASINHELPDLRPTAARLWSELSQVHALPLGACAVVSPEGLVQGPASASGDAAHLTFGLVARPEIRLRCGQALPPGKPLPPLGSSPSLAPDGDVHLAFVLPGTSAEQALTGAALDLGKARAVIRKATGDAATGFLLGVRGEACGEYRASVVGLAWKDDAALHLTGAEVAAADAPRLVGEGLDPTGLARGVESASIAVPMAVHDLVRTLPELVQGLSDANATIGARVLDGQPERAGLRGTDLIAVAKLRGSVTVQPK
jgi:hypothetical protein